jgi:hypothetical protein
MPHKVKEGSKAFSFAGTEKSECTFKTRKFSRRKTLTRGKVGK